MAQRAHCHEMLASVCVWRYGNVIHLHVFVRMKGKMLRVLREIRRQCEIDVAIEGHKEKPSHQRKVTFDVYSGIML